MKIHEGSSKQNILPCFDPLGMEASRFPKEQPNGQVYDLSTLFCAQKPAKRFKSGTLTVDVLVFHCAWADSSEISAGRSKQVK